MALRMTQRSVPSRLVTENPRKHRRLALQNSKSKPFELPKLKLALALKERWSTKMIKKQKLMTINVPLLPRSRHQCGKGRYTWFWAGPPSPAVEPPRPPRSPAASRPPTQPQLHWKTNCENKNKDDQLNNQID